MVILLVSELATRRGFVFYSVQFCQHLHRHRHIRTRFNKTKFHKIVI